MVDLLNNIKPEERLLISLCHLDFTESEKSKISELMKSVTDWNYFVRMSNEHGIIALAAFNLKETGLDNQIPKDAMADLENGYLKSVVRNTWLTERWKEVNAILCNAGIKHILLKGMALERTLYKSKGLRQMNDNDILIQSGDALKAWYLLQQNGYSPEPLKSPLLKKIMFDTGKHLPCLYKNGYAIEIHVRLFNNRPGDEKIYNEAFVNSPGIMIDNINACILPEKLQLSHLLDHYRKHLLAGSFQLRLYTDIVLLDKNIQPEIPDSFISHPQQEEKLKYLRAAYKEAIRSVPPKSRLRYLAGDIFPAVGWMKQRYKCNGLKAVFYYPLRIGKLLWLI